MIKKFLANLKWAMLPVTFIVLALFVEAGTDSDGISSSEEGLMYAAWLLVIANVCLFIFDKRWKQALDNWL